MVKVGVIDYGVGNLKSLTNALNQLGVASVVSNDSSELEKCTHLILPGVGAFGAAKALLTALQLDRFIIRSAQSGKPILGICLGMQLLMDSSTEFGEHKGLGLISGKVENLKALKNNSDEQMLLPNVNWLKVKLAEDNGGWLAAANLQSMYFIHSFGVAGHNSHCLGQAHYCNTAIAAIVGRDSVFGVQFHPEKSRGPGLNFLKSFTDWRVE